ncbi:MAG: aminoglycoside phosphotransferase family protein [Candidatus Cloacimonetes bacterium]|nr:aminoglycoside phosphotransferase family protein [Candidatus Cloacimonadota bacterium]
MELAEIREYKFAKRIVALYGDEGAAWLEALPSLLQKWAVNRHLKEIIPQNISNYNFIGYGLTEDNLPVVIKTGFPAKEISLEIAALSAFRSNYMIKALAIDRENQLVLLPRLLPGTPLHRDLDDEQQTIIAAGLMKEIKTPVQSDFNFPLLTDWFRKISQFKADKSLPIPGKFLANAEHIFAELQKEEFQPLLLHGDLHHYNILRYDEDWIIIDPKGVVGNPLYETACFLYNPSPLFHKVNHPQDIIKRRIAIFNEILGYSREQIAAMAYCQSVLSACWCLEDKEDCWQNALAWADIFYLLL